MSIPTDRAIAVLGLGNWGTALANHLATKGFRVTGWSLDDAVVSSIQAVHRNSKYLTEVTLSSNLSATTNLSDAAKADVIVLAVPAKALESVVPALAPRPEQLFVSGIKGLISGTDETPLQYLRRVAPASKGAVLSGPSFATDLVQQRPVGVVAASSVESVSREVAEIFSNEVMRVYLSTDPLGVELGGVLKNVVALAAGVSDGLGFGESALAGLITRGLAEMMRLAVAMGADQQTLFGLSGLGDLAMTATCNTSRNRTVGLRLGRGEKLDQIVATLGSVAEGVRSTPTVLDLGRRYGVELPITEAVNRLIAGECTAVETARSLLSRPLRREF